MAGTCENPTDKGNIMATCNFLPDALCSFPAIGDQYIRETRKVVDDGFKGIVREYGYVIDAVTQPLQWFLNYFERLFTNSPWIVVLVVLLAIVYLGSRSIKITIGTAVAMCAIGMIGLWNDAMITLAITTVATLIAIVIGIPIGILMARSDRIQGTINPILDVMQTLPSFVYLIPVVVIFGIGKVPGLIAVVIYAVPPMIRLTNLGIRLVDKEVLEAADAFGSSSSQKLWNVQLPLALPTIMAGINQTIMLSLSMVVIASMIGAGGIGNTVLTGIQRLDVGTGFEGGLAVVILAVILDRITQSLGQKTTKRTALWATLFRKNEREELATANA